MISRFFRGLPVSVIHIGAVILAVLVGWIVFGLGARHASGVMYIPAPESTEQGELRPNSAVNPLDPNPCGPQARDGLDELESFQTQLADDSTILCTQVDRRLIPEVGASVIVGGLLASLGVLASLVSLRLWQQVKDEDSQQSLRSHGRTAAAGAAAVALAAYVFLGSLLWLLWVFIATVPVVIFSGLIAAVLSGLSQWTRSQFDSDAAMADQLRQHAKAVSILRTAMFLMAIALSGAVAFSVAWSYRIIAVRHERMLNVTIPGFGSDATLGGFQVEHAPLIATTLGIVLSCLIVAVSMDAHQNLVELGERIQTRLPLAKADALAARAETATKLGLNFSFQRWFETVIAVTLPAITGLLAPLLNF